jgi:hypothetical protein
MVAVVVVVFVVVVRGRCQGNKACSRVDTYLCTLVSAQLRLWNEKPRNATRVVPTTTISVQSRSLRRRFCRYFL